MKYTASLSPSKRFASSVNECATATMVPGAPSTFAIARAIADESTIEAELLRMAGKAITT
jgi:hypothetical protein